MEETELRRAWDSQFNDWKHYEKGSQRAEEKGYILLSLF